MKTIFSFFLILIGFISFGQEDKVAQIDSKINLIDSDSTLIETEYDWIELTGITTDGGGILKVWKKENQIYKIYEEVGLSYGRIRTTMYLENEMPIKIIETEENFVHINNELNYNKLNEVFKVEFYVFDWENDDCKIYTTGKRVMSEGELLFEYEPLIERAKLNQ